MTGADVPERAITRHANIRQFATFHVADMFMGIELSRVQELMRYQEMAPVPLAPATVEGLINLRGQIVTALNMRRIFSLPPMNATDRKPMNIVIRTEGGAVSFLVDEICDVLDVRQDTWTQLPANFPAVQRTFLQGVYQLESRLLMVVDTERVVSMGAD
ncbi:MAG: chemotaxis protein CheW [Acidobacteriaceae bacterium]